MNRKIAMVLGLFLVAPGSFGLSSDAKGGGFSVGIDLVSLGYDQALVYFELPVTPRIGADVAIGYSPGGLWNSSFQYWYLQADLRSYLLDENRELYTGFGVAAYWAAGVLDFSKWDIKPLFDSSVVAGVTGTVGWKHYFNGIGGLYVDPNLFVYALAPLSVVATSSAAKAEFQYKPFSVLASAIVGYSF